jgi:hypothetical protein
MIATNRNTHDGGSLVRAIRGFAAALGLLALCCASGAKADAVSAGQRAFACHGYVREASAGSCREELRIEAANDPCASARFAPQPPLHSMP